MSGDLPRARSRAGVLPAVVAWLVLLGAASASPAQRTSPIEESSAWFALEVDRRLEVPDGDRMRYLEQVQAELTRAGVTEPSAQHVLMVDRDPNVQAALVVARSDDGRWHWIGAAPVSSGRPGSFDHFRTPTGVFTHGLDNLDFRAEGTVNELGVRGYGARGMRVFDFGWVAAERGWGRGGLGQMRLQVHATDARLLEPRLGRTASKGCIRIPATLNTYLDRHAILDADYEQALARGMPLWMIRADRQPTPWPGRYLVIVDSATMTRPAWSPDPAARSTPSGPKPIRPAR